MRPPFSTEQGLVQITDLWEASKTIAREQFKNPTVEQMLARWWTQKYHLPSNHELFQSRTLLDLLVEYQLDKLYEKPLEAYKTADGEYHFVNTGDELIDKWEQELAEGRIPDLSEAFSPEDYERVIRVSTRYYESKNDPRNVQSFGDVYKEVARVERLAREQAAKTGKKTFGDY